MNIETKFLNINDISAAKRFSTMDKESLISYIGKVCLSLELEKDGAELKNVLYGVIYEIFRNKCNFDEEKVNSISTTFATTISKEFENYTYTEDLSKEKIEQLVEPLIDKLAFIIDSDLETIKDFSQEQQLLSIGVVNDTIADDEIKGLDSVSAKNKLNQLPENILNIISNIKSNILNKSKKFLEKIELVQKVDFWTKATLGLILDLFGGNLISKLVYLNVNENDQMLEKIKNEGIVHFTSNANADKILNSGDNYIKSSGIMLSGGKKRTYFFAGLPSFKDITINIYSYNVMYGVRIKPTAEQLEKLTYREYNDKAVAYNRDFHFSSEQVEKVYYGLKIDEEKNLFYEEITEEQAKNYRVSDELRKIYNGDGSLKHKLMCNAYGFYYELGNYIKLLKRIKNRDFQIESLDEQYDSNHIK